MKETLANKIEAMQRRMLTNAAGARKRAYDASIKKRDDAAAAVARNSSPPADVVEPAAGSSAKR
jgi:hypothetical protein